MKRPQHFPSHPIPLLAICCLLPLVLSGCLRLFAPEAAPIEPTRTPIPTFTPTVEVAVPDSVATAAAVAAAPNGDAPAATEPPIVEAPTLEAAPPTDTPAAEEPTATPTPEPATAVVTQGMNVRGGPGTNYAIIGAAQAGDRFVIKGKDSSSAWWQVDFNGRDGWLFGQLATANNAEGVAVAQNIPTPPPPPTNTPVPPPANTPVPAAPTAPPPPTTNYKFNVAVVGKCERQPAGNWFEGKTYIGGQPASGYKVAFSYAPDAAPVATIISGPHAGYEGWDAGYYSHIINASGPKAGNWFVWIVDDGGNRISEIANWQSTGPGDGCNQAVVDFDSR